MLTCFQDFLMMLHPFHWTSVISFKIVDYFLLMYCMWENCTHFFLMLFWLFTYTFYCQLTRKPVKKVGAFCWLSLAICIVELLICIKFGHGMSLYVYVNFLLSLTLETLYSSVCHNYIENARQISISFIKHFYPQCFNAKDSLINNLLCFIRFVSYFNAFMARYLLVICWCGSCYILACLVATTTSESREEAAITLLCQIVH